MADLARLTDLFTEEAETLGFELVRVKLFGSGLERTLQIMAEDPATGQLIVAQCGELSRAVSRKIDALEEAGEELIAGAYHLEVSSPGIDRPLTRTKDYANWAGHEAKIALSEKIDGMRRLAGKLVGIDGDMITIEDSEAGVVAVPLNAIHSAQLVMTDALIAATVPLDTSGADEIDENPEDELSDNNMTEEKA